MTFHRECGQGSTTADADDNINKRKGRSVVRVNHGTFGITPVFILLMKLALPINLVLDKHICVVCYL